MNSNIENLNGILRALILKQREDYVLETMETLEQYLIEENLPLQEVQEYMENARKIVFKK
tara:strand:+ start:221 stop:400 length:180 start_codon:yes stop_codon:yes gene_type:complete